MATYTVAHHKNGAYAKTLVAATVDTVTFEDEPQLVEITSDGAAAIYFTLDGSTPTVGGEGTYEVPATPAVRVVDVPNQSPKAAISVKLISAGTPKYSVSKAVRD